MEENQDYRMKRSLEQQQEQLNIDILLFPINSSFIFSRWSGELMINNKTRHFCWFHRSFVYRMFVTFGFAFKVIKFANDTLFTFIFASRTPMQILTSRYRRISYKFGKNTAGALLEPSVSWDRRRLESGLRVIVCVWLRVSRVPIPHFKLHYLDWLPSPIGPTHSCTSIPLRLDSHILNVIVQVRTECYLIDSHW